MQFTYTVNKKKYSVEKSYRADLYKDSENVTLKKPVAVAKTVKKLLLF